MKRTIVQLPGEIILKITEETGEIHYRVKETPQPDGYRIFHGYVCPILTQSEIDTTPLPHLFNVEDYSVYPAENETLFPYLHMSLTLLGRSIVERIARIHIARHLNLYVGE